MATQVGKGAIIAGPLGAVVAAIDLAFEVPFVPAYELLKTVRPGDLIEFDRGVYKHWAMYSDETGMIINIPAESKNVNEVTITKEKLLDVAGSSGVRVNNQTKVAAKLKLDGQRRSPTEAVKAAKSYLGKTVPYHFTTTNCEYYSTEWLYGRGFTIQYDQVTAHVHGGYFAMVGTIIGGPIGGIIGYVVGSAAVGGAMSDIFDTTKTTHYIHGESPRK